VRRLSAISIGIFVFAVSFCMPAAPALAQTCEPRWLPGEGLPGVGGTVYAATVWDPDGAGPQPEWLVVGGDFIVAGDVLANNIAAWNGSAWQPLGDGTDGTVRALTVYNGELFAGGEFTTAGSATVNYVARWNGSIWQSLGSGMNGSVFSLAVYSGKLIAGGSFTTASGADANRVASWGGSAWQPLGLGASTTVHALVVYNSQLVLGASSVYLWTGSVWQPLGAVSGEVYALASYGGELIAGGDFACNGTVRGDYVVRWDGSSWYFLINASGLKEEDSVYALTVYDGELIAGGSRFSIGIASWNGSIWQPLGGMGGVIQGETDPACVYALASYNGQLIAGGRFDTAGDVGADYVARWDGSTWHSLGEGMNNPVDILSVHNGELIAGGVFVSAGGTTVNSIARWNGLAWQALGSGMNGSVFSLTVYNGALIAGGLFTTAGGVSANRIAGWNGSTWQPLGLGMSINDPYWVAVIRDLAMYDGELIAAGTFTSAGGVAVNNIARWNGLTWQPLGSGISGQVYALTVYDGALIAGGKLSIAGGVTANAIARWNGSVWEPLGSGMGSPYGLERVDDLTVYNGELIAGGYFTTAGGVECACIARWNGVAWHPLGSGMDLPVGALTVYNGELIAGGSFSTAGGASANHVARWNGLAWRPLGNGVNDYVAALIEFNGKLAMAGWFNIAGGQVSGHWARWSEPLPSITEQPASLAVHAGHSAVLSVVASGTGTVTYQWRKDAVPLVDGGSISGATTATLTINPAYTADAGNYDVLVIDDCRSVPSDPATLTILCPPGDVDCDGDVDQVDFGRFQACLSGAGVAQNAPECDRAHLDGDIDVDQADFALFQRCLSGPDVLANAGCLE